jgi:hypothetical protein
VIDDWSSYRPADFVPYGAQAWSGLIERVNEAFWPLQILALALGIGILLLLRNRRPRAALVLLALPWAWVGVTFFIQRYAELNWAGAYPGWLFVAQGVVLLLASVFARSRPEADRLPGPGRTSGLVLAGGTLLLFPLIGALAGGSLLRAELFGLHPDATVAASIGLIAAAGLRPLLALAAMLLPIGWCLISALHLQVLEAGWWPLLPLLAVYAGGTSVRAILERRRDPE